MKCQGCGHEYLSTLTRCTRCKLKNPELANSSPRSTVVQFPLNTAASSDQSVKETSIPDWRTELNERVRAIKARRNVQHSPIGTAAAPTRARSESGFENTASEDARSSSVSALSSKTSNPVVEAALMRVRAASESASRPSGDSALATGAKRAIAVDREATAKALEIAEESRAEPERELVTRPLVDKQPLHPRAQASAPAREIVPPAADIEYDSPDIGEAPLFDMEPRDYLSDEVNKIRKQSARAGLEGIPSPLMHLIVNAIDIVVILLSCAPFFAIVEILEGDLGDRGTLAAAVSMGILVSLFYFSLTQTLCAQTFGMMVTGARIVDARTQETPAVWKLLVRSAGYFVAILPGLVGLMWIVVSPYRRGWHDLVSGTMVVRD